MEMTDTFSTLVSKLVGHYGYFVVLGVVSIAFYLNIPKISKITAIILHFSVGFLFAFISEFVAERMTSGRHASMVDVLIDMAGLITLSILIIIYNLRKNKPLKY